MVQRRERLKKQLLQSQAEVLELESRLLEEEIEMEDERRENESAASPTVRQTR